MRVATIILAAGKGTRMKSNLIKVLHPLGGKPILWHALNQAAHISSRKPTLVVGYQAEKVQAVFGDAADYIYQKDQLGTGHAVLQTRDHLRDKADLVVVLLGDMPLIRTETLEGLIEEQKKNTGPFSVLTLVAENSRGFGRIIRNSQGEAEAIVEEIDCTPEQRKIKELNVSIYCFQADWLWHNLDKIQVSAKGEYYLTEMVAIARAQGLNVHALAINDPQEAMGINNRVHLSDAEAILRRRINEGWMLEGVTILDPATTYIEAGVSIGQDTTLHPNTILQGDTRIGSDCIIGPNTLIRDSQLGSHCEVFASVIEQATLENHVDIGPFAHLRRGAHLGEGVHMGNFGEIKNSYLAPGVKMGHFSYIGDATIGKNVNIGAGTITCNYDGENKHHTTIEEGAFIGSDTMLIAPLKIGKGARTGAGAVVNKDVESGTTVVGVPAQKLRKVDSEGE